MAPDSVGEIVNRGDFTMGYDKNPDATARAIKNGWDSTGDPDRKDQEGFIVDRKKDMIVTGGENVYSREVEEVISAHPRSYPRPLPPKPGGIQVPEDDPVPYGTPRKRRGEDLEKGYSSDSASVGETKEVSTAWAEK